MPNPFDIDQILAKRTAEAEATIPTKFAEVTAVIQNKLDTLNGYAQENAQRQAQRAAEREAAKASLVGQLGLDTNSFAGSAVNLGASVASGASRFAGNILAIPDSTASNLLIQGTTDQEQEAVRSHRAGTATPEQSALVNFRPDNNSLTLLEKFDASRSARDASLAINQDFDKTALIDPTRRNAFVADIQNNFETDFGSVKQGLANISEGEIVSGVGNLAKGVGSLLATAGRAIVNNPGAVTEHIAENIPQLAVGAFGPVGVGVMTTGNIGFAMDIFQQGIVERTKANGGVEPTMAERAEMGNLAVAHVLSETVGDFVTLGAAGALTKGVKDGIRTNFLNSVKNIGKAGAEGAISEAPTEATQTFLEGEILGKPATAKDIFTAGVIGGAVGSGLASTGRTATEASILANQVPLPKTAVPEDTLPPEQAEIVTKAIDTGDVSGLVDPTNKETYAPDAAIRALFGNSQKEDATSETKQANLTKADEILDDLDTQIQLNKSGLETAADIQTKIDALEARKANADPTNIEAFQAGIDALIERKADVEVSPPITALQEAKLNREITRLEGLAAVATAARDELEQLIQPGESIDTLVSTVNTPVVSNPPELQAAIDFVSSVDAGGTALTANKVNKIAEGLGLEIDRNATPEVTTQRLRDAIERASPVTSTVGANTQAVNQAITLAMRSPRRLTGEQATQLADNTNNTLTDDQRGFLRKLTEARVAQDALIDLGGVSADIYLGKQTTNKNKGLKQFREIIGRALASKNKAKADSELQQLNDFNKSHNSKEAVTREALATGVPTQVHAKEGTFFIPKGDQLFKGTEEEIANQLKKNGGLLIHKNSTKLVDSIALEADAINKTLAELNAAYAIQFNTVPTKDKDANNTSEKPKDVIPPVTEKANPARKDVKAEQPDSKVSEEVTTEVVVESVPDTNTAVDDETVVEDTQTGLKVLLKERTKKDESKTYVDRNLLADFFTQEANKGGDTSQRPLVVVQDFLTNRKFMQYLPDSKITEDQSIALRAFIRTAESWQDTIKSNLVKINSPKFRYTDLMQFLLTEDTQGGIDVEENVKTAIAYGAFNWIIAAAGRNTFNGPEEINLILGRPSDTKVTPKEQAKLGNVGTQQSFVANSMGLPVVQALGFKTVNAPENLDGNLQSALGGHVLKLLLDLKVVERVVLTNDEMNALRPTTDEEISDRTEHVFIRLVRDKGTDKLSELGQSIVDVNRGTKGILDKLFSVDAGMTAPSHEAIPYEQVSVKGQGIPSVAKKILTKQNATPSFLDNTMWQFASTVSNETLMKVIGFKDTSESHAINIAGIEANNNALQRSIDNLAAFVNEMFTNGKPDLNKPTYFSHVLQATQRMGIATNLVNPQSNKYHRFMFSRAAWNTEITEANLDDFYLRVAEGLGIKTDKQSNAKALTKLFDQIPEITPGVDALVRMIEDTDVTEMSAADQEAILKAVNIGKENTHTLAALTALAQLRIAEATALKDSTPLKFTARLMGEVDGVNNGVMLAHLALGAGKTKEELFDTLNRGGFFEQGNPDHQYNLWRDAANHFDLYENVAQRITKGLTGITNQGITDRFGKVKVSKKAVGFILPAIYKFTGTLQNVDETVTSAGRNIAKTPVLSIAFGSSANSAVANMTDGFIESIYAAIEDTSANRPGSMSLSDLIDNINKVMLLGSAPTIPTNTSIQVLMGQGTGNVQVFTTDQLAAMTKTFKDTVGEVAKSSLESKFFHLIEQRTQVNTAAQLAHEIYDSAETALHNQLIKDQMELFDTSEGKEGIAYTLRNIGKPNETRIPIHGLTPKQIASIDKVLLPLAPYTHTVLSKKDGDVTTGVYLSKRDNKLGNQPFNKNNIKFGTSIKGTNTSGISISSESIVSASPGVRTVPVLTHSTESASLLGSLNDSAQQLSIFDAIGTGIGQMKEAAQSINKSLWDNMLTYSPASEVYNTLARILMGYSTLIKGGTLPSAALEQLNKAVTVLLEKHDEVSLKGLVSNAKQAAFKADDIKLQTMSTMESVDQYALEGGNYQVTDTDRATAIAERKLLVEEVDGQVLEAINTIQNELTKLTNPVIETATVNIEEDTSIIEPGTSVFGKLGTPTIIGDPDLIKFFSENTVTSPARVIAGLKRKYSKKDLPNSEFNLLLLDRLSKVIDDKLTIKYVTEGTQAQEVLDTPTDAVHGWFSRDKDTQTIYVLGTDFVNSNITPELLLHELVHAALVMQVRNPTEASKEHIAELKTILSKAQIAVKDNKGFSEIDAAINSDNADNNLDELIAYGMTNQKFQQEVLGQIEVGTKTKPVTALQKFIDKITAILFRGFSKKPIINSGMASLVENVTSLLELSTQEQATSDSVITLNMAAQSAPLDATDSYTTLDIFDAMDNGAIPNSRFKTDLRNLLTGIVDNLHGPYGAFKESLRKDEAKNPLAVWLKTLDSGKAPFASQILASGFTGSNQQDFVMEQVEATVRAAITDRAVTTTEIFKDLDALYAETKKRLKPVDFLGGAFHTNTMEEAQALYDFVFKLDSKHGKQSDYLSRFAAIGLAHRGFNRLLQVSTNVNPKVKGKTFAEKIQNIFEAILEFFHRRITGTYAGQSADFKLETLVESLVDIESKRRHALKREAAQNKSYFEPIEKRTKEAVETALAKTVKAFGSAKVRKSKNVFVRATGGVVRTVAGRQLDTFLATMSDFRDSQFEGQLGVAAGLINNVKGPLVAFQTLLRARKQSEGAQVKDNAELSRLILSKFTNEGKDLDNETKSAITRIFLDTGAHALTDFMSLSEIENLLGNPTAIQAEITKLSDRLDVFGNLKDEFIAAANGLGYDKATGVNRITNLRQNAYQIANRFGKQATLNATQTKQAIEIITPLITLYALRYSNSTELVNDEKVTHMSLAKKVMQTENAKSVDQPNGVEFVLLLSKYLETQSQAALFKGNPAQMVHGFMPQIYNPRTLIQTANEVDGQDLLDQGYSKSIGIVPIDPADPNKEIKHIYSLGDGGLAPHLTAIIGYGSKKAAGTKVSSGYADINTLTTVSTASAIAAIKAHRVRADAQSARLDPNRDLSKETGNFMAPVFNEKGDTVSYRYKMANHTKDTLLERNTSFEKILGTLSGTIIGKPATIADNKVAVSALRDQFESEFATKGSAYIDVGATSTDPELRAIWAKLPDETRQDIRNIWGRDGMMVRKDSIDIMFGYRKISAADPFKRANEERARLKAAGLPADLSELESINAAQKVIIFIVERMLVNSARSRGLSLEESERFAKRAAALVAKGENMWQGVVTEIKDIIVVKSGLVLAGNIFANFSFLYLQGVPVRDMIRHTLVAFKGATAHRADTVELHNLRAELATGYTQGREAEIKRRILILETALERNPVNILITEAGLMPTIVEDVDMSEDIYSFKGVLAKKVDKLSAKLPGTVVDVARTMYMTRDGKMYQGLAHLTQMSDFVARYALYQHETTRKVNPISHQEAVQRASDAFVNYDIPLHRGLQYSDDMGFTLFTKYFLYIQRILLRVTREQPARVLTMVMLNNFMNLGPIVLDSSALESIGNNPLRPGALAFPGVLDELATVSTTMAIIK